MSENLCFNCWKTTPDGIICDQCKQWFCIGCINQPLPGILTPKPRGKSSWEILVIPVVFRLFPVCFKLANKRVKRQRKGKSMAPRNLTSQGHKSAAYSVKASTSARPARRSLRESTETNCNVQESLFQVFGHWSHGQGLWAKQVMLLLPQEQSQQWLLFPAASLDDG